MRILPIIKISWILPYFGLKGLINKNKDLKTNYAFCHKYSKLALKLMGYKINVKGVENIEGDSILFISNHQGTIDPALIIASNDKPLSFISKKENENIPILGRWAKNIKNIHFDRDSREGNVHMLREALRYLKNKQNILIFPEGTRSKADKMNNFKENSLKLALMSKATIIPVSISGSYCLDRKDIKIKELSIVYDKALKYEDYKDMKQDVLSDYIHNIIEKNIVNYESF